VTAPTRTDRRGAPPRRARRPIARLSATIVLAGIVVACGKKAPPLPPIIYVPAAPAVTALEQGRTARLAFTVPVANTNGSRPANLDHLLVYGFTGTPDVTNLERFFKRATLVARVPVKPAPPPGSDEAENPPPPPSKAPGFAQGDTALVSETITPALTIPVPPEHAPKKPKTPVEEAPTMAVPLGWPSDAVAVRSYYVVGVTNRGRDGPLSTPVSVPLVPPPDAPSQPTVTYTEKAISITWKPPAFVRASVQAPVVAAKAPATAATPTAAAAPATGRPAPAGAGAIAAASGGQVPKRSAPVTGKPAGTTPPVEAAPPVVLSGTPIGPDYPPSRYNVYEVPKTPAQKPAWMEDAKGDGTIDPGPPPSPLNSQPLEVTSYSDTRITWGQERCYVIRTIDTYDKLTIDSVPSPATCVTLKDTFPPAAPRGLQAVAASGAISLIWEPNTESDLAGYLVLRAVAPDGRPVPITSAPIQDTTYRDATVTPGVRYIYTIVAVDTAKNHSKPSQPVLETAQ